MESSPLTEEDEVAARTSEFQVLQREQKNKRKKSRLHILDDILEVFWATYVPSHFRACSYLCCGLFSVICHGLGGEMLGDTSNTKLI